uniref:Uncharacterized protein n=1 Tax=Caenorhabditis japonica TaxID=281687 RepID=A0A8R1DHJ2_CAEJA
MQNLWHPAIFCLSNGVANWKLNPDRIFTTGFIQQNGLQSLSFNPVADSFVKKALVRASGLLSRPLSDAKCNVIANEAQGDLRLAMNMLQMNAIGPNSDRNSGAKMVFAAKANREETFHMIGRILYAKRVNPNMPKTGRFAPRKRKSSLIPEPKERTALEHDPTDIIAMSSMSSDKLASFLFENEHVFCSDISKYRQVVENLSFCDMLTGDWHTKRALPEEYVAQIATRSVMWHNYKGSRPGTLYQVRRPVINDLNRDIEMTRNEVRKLPLIGSESFTYLNAPYQTKIEGLIDPRRVECFLSRSFLISWKSGRDQIEDQMEKSASLRKPRKIPKHVVEIIEIGDEEETWDIEDSSDDSFDDF